MSYMEAREYVVLGLIVVACFVASAFLPELSMYCLLAGFISLGFFIYLKIRDTSPSFDFVEYDELISEKLNYVAIKNFKGEIKRVALTGEDVFEYKILGDCCGYWNYSFDIFPEKFKQIVEKGISKRVEDLQYNKVGSRQVYCFLYEEFSTNFIRCFLQKSIPRIPILSQVMGLIPIINQLCFPDVRGVITGEQRVKFKNGVAEINAKSLFPLSCKKTFNAYYITEYEGKSDESRKLERFLFAKEIFSDELIKLVNTAKNTSDIGAKLNPQVNLDKEKSLVKTGN